jgi:hypothetical protein
LQGLEDIMSTELTKITKNISDYWLSYLSNEESILESFALLVRHFSKWQDDLPILESYLELYVAYPILSKLNQVDLKDEYSNRDGPIFRIRNDLDCFLKRKRILRKYFINAICETRSKDKVFEVNLAAIKKEFVSSFEHRGFQAVANNGNLLDLKLNDFLFQFDFEDIAQTRRSLKLLDTKTFTNLSCILSYSFQGNKVFEIDLDKLIPIVSFGGVKSGLLTFTYIDEFESMAKDFQVLCENIFQNEDYTKIFNAFLHSKSID